MGMQPGTVGSPTAPRGGAQTGMMGVPPGATVNSGAVLGMQPGMMGMPWQPNMYGMQPGMVGVPQQQMMMGMQAGMVGMPYQQNTVGMQPGMMQTGVFGSQQNNWRVVWWIVTFTILQSIMPVKVSYDNPVRYTYSTFMFSFPVYFRFTCIIFDAAKATNDIKWYMFYIILHDGLKLPRCHCLKCCHIMVHFSHTYPGGVADPVNCVVSLW